MKIKEKMVSAAGLGLFFFLLSAQNAYAYLDPGTGSYFFQILIASLLAALFLIKNFWSNLVEQLKKLFSKAAGIIKKPFKNA
ncbi:MAG: hypothetical protein PHW43_10005 [Syntrophales bacterium]|nr:hypothetical protein [Syntrophales bacterium]